MTKVIGSSVQRGKTSKSPVDPISRRRFENNDRRKSATCLEPTLSNGFPTRTKYEGRERAKAVRQFRGVLIRIRDQNARKPSARNNSHAHSHSAGVAGSVASSV